MSCHLLSPPEILFVSLHVPPLPRPNPAPAPEGRSHWDLESFLNLGLRQSAQIKNFGSRLQVAGAWPPEAVRCQGIAGSPSGRQEVRGAQDQTLGTGLRRAWAGGQPRPVLVYQRRLSQCHAFLARNYFQESSFGDIIGPCSERAFYSN